MMTTIMESLPQIEGSKLTLIHLEVSDMISILNLFFVTQIYSTYPTQKLHYYQLDTCYNIAHFYIYIYIYSRGGK